MDARLTKSHGMRCVSRQRDPPAPIIPRLSRPVVHMIIVPNLRIPRNGRDHVLERVCQMLTAFADIGQQQIIILAERIVIYCAIGCPRQDN